MSNRIYGNITTDGIYEMEEEEVTSDANADTIRRHDVRKGTKKQIPQCTGSEFVKMRSSRAATVCLGLLCVLLLTAVIALSVQIFTNIDLFHIKSKNIMEERNQLLSKFTKLAEESNKLINKNINLTKERNGLLTENNNLTKERDLCKQERNELWKKLNETDGWLYSKFSFYFISSVKKSWSESRRFCTERGADLIIINNSEEQEFFKKFSGGNGVWIGLSDSDEKGRWKWVDGTNMTSGFWASGELDKSRHKNCARSYSSVWYNDQCEYEHRWICEKSFMKDPRP